MPIFGDNELLIFGLLAARGISTDFLYYNLDSDTPVSGFYTAFCGFDSDAGYFSHYLLWVLDDSLFFTVSLGVLFVPPVEQ